MEIMVRTIENRTLRMNYKIEVLFLFFPSLFGDKCLTNLIRPMTSTFKFFLRVTKKSRDSDDGNFTRVKFHPETVRRMRRNVGCRLYK